MSLTCYSPILYTRFFIEHPFLSLNLSIMPSSSDEFLKLRRATFEDLDDVADMIYAACPMNPQYVALFPWIIFIHGFYLVTLALGPYIRSKNRDP